jgi:NAD+ synthase
MARELGVIESILRAKPTDGLWGDDRSDEDQIGASYPEVEWAMDLRYRGVDIRHQELTDRQHQVLAIFDQRHAANRHKMEPIPVCLIPEGFRE